MPMSRAASTAARWMMARLSTRVPSTSKTASGRSIIGGLRGGRRARPRPRARRSRSARSPRASRGSSGASTTSRPCEGWSRSTRRACSCSFSPSDSSREASSPYFGSPRMGWPMAFMWALQLVGPSRVGAQRHPGGAGAGAADGDELGLGGLGAELLRVGGHHHLAVAHALLDQVQLDHPFLGLGVAHDDGPVGLLGPAPGEGAGQLGGRARGLAEQQHAGGVAVQPVHQARPLQPFAPGRQQTVDVAGGLGAALHGEAGGLVQRQHLVVLVEHERLGEGDVLGREGGARGLVALAGLGQRRHAHLLAGGQPGVGLGAGAVDADLAGAQQLLDLALAQVRKAPLEPAVDPHAVLVRLHGNGQDGSHFGSLPGKSLRSIPAEIGFYSARRNAANGITSPPIDRHSRAEACASTLETREPSRERSTLGRLDASRAWRLGSRVFGRFAPFARE